MTRTAVVGVIASITLGTAIVLGILVFGVDDSATPFITTVLGFVGLAVGQFVATGKAERAEENSAEVNRSLHNGTMRRLVREAIQEMIDDPASPLNLKIEGRENPDG